jgi:hypothetical protein
MDPKFEEEEVDLNTNVIDDIAKQLHMQMRKKKKMTTIGAL